MANLPRTLSPTLNSTGYIAAAGAVYAAAAMIYNVAHHDGVISVPVILAAITAVGALLTRQRVTPIADPVDGAGRPLVPKSAVSDELSRWRAAMEAYENPVPLRTLNAIRAESGLEPLPPDAAASGPLLAHGGGAGGEFAAGDMHVVTAQPFGVSRVIVENQEPA
jgi:hypothetical protein